MSLDDSDAQRVEHGTEFLPRFDDRGLLAAVVTHKHTGQVLMLAWMDREAIDRTVATGLAHFHSRSRGRLWLKGETSGHTMKVAEIRVDCDQDALELRVEPQGPACHTLATSCFYRTLEDGALQTSD